jgi:streptogramin lyase
MAVGSDGNVWFTIPFAGIGRLNPDGSVSVFTAGITSDSVRQITPGPDGNLWFTEFNSPQHIGKVTTAGVITEVATAGVTPGLPNGNIEDITTGPDGNVWFSMPFISPGTQGAIGRINPADNSVTVYTATYDTTTTPRGVTGGPDGNVWFTDDAAGVIGKIARRHDHRRRNLGHDPGFTGVNPFTLTTGSDGNLWVNLTGAVARVIDGRGRHRVPSTTVATSTTSPRRVTACRDHPEPRRRGPGGDLPRHHQRRRHAVHPGAATGSIPSGSLAVPTATCTSPTRRPRLHHRASARLRSAAGPGRPNFTG